MTGPEVFAIVRDIIQKRTLLGEISVWRAWQPSCRVPTVYKARAIMVRYTAALRSPGERKLTGTRRAVDESVVMKNKRRAVSYTHLTLPTKRIV